MYIALYPPQNDDDPEFREELLSASPSKMSRMAARNHKTSHTPTPAHSAAAQRVLQSFAQTNSPAALLRALPSYEDPDEINFAMRRADGEIYDSEISRFSRRIADARSCWEVLKEGFLRPEVFAQDAPASPTKNRRSRRSARLSMSDEEDMVAGSPGPVGPLAWPVLDWLLTVLEKDEASPPDCDHGTPMQ